MLMQALEAGGMPIAKSDERDEYGESRNDSEYKTNPFGLFEIPMSELHRADFVAKYDGMGVKVAPAFLKSLPRHVYRIAFMQRDTEEIRQSYEASFGLRTTAVIIAVTLRDALRSVQFRSDIQSIWELWYARVVEDAVGELSNLRWPIDVTAAARVVDPSYYRFRREVLVEGI